MRRPKMITAIAIFVSAMLGLFAGVLLSACKISCLQDQIDHKCDECPYRKRVDVMV
jgi:hypothetical protein